MKSSDIGRIVQKHEGRRGSLIGILQDIQTKFNYLPTEALKEVATETGRSLVDIYGVATFYRAFSLSPRGKHLVSICLGTACHVRGAPTIAEEFERQLKVKAGGTTEDREFTLETVNCLGACALGPIVVVDGHYFSQVNSTRVKGILKKVKSGLDEVELKGNRRIFPVRVACPHCNRSLMDGEHPIDDFPSVRLTVSSGDDHGALRLSCLYGSFNTTSDYEIPKDEIVHVFCPHCHGELVGASMCSDCGAPMVPMLVAGGGLVQICSRRGCRSHMLDLTGVNM